jgi:hypothetical protein
VERNLAQRPEPATHASDFKLLAAPCCQVWVLNAPSNKLKGGCWPNFGRLGAPPQRFKRKLLCYLPANAAFNRYALPDFPPEFSWISSTVSRFAATKAQWTLEAFGTSSQTDFGGAFSMTWQQDLV